MRVKTRLFVSVFTGKQDIQGLLMVSGHVVSPVSGA